MLLRTVSRATILRQNRRAVSTYHYESFRLDMVPDLPVKDTVKLAEQHYKALKSTHIDASLPPIVMLHGLFGSKQNFGSVGRELATRTARSVFGLDLRNHGHSPHAFPHDYSTMARDVIKHMKHRGWKDAILVGHSMGAKTAMLVAMQEPELVGKLVVVDNSPAAQPLSDNFRRDLVGMCQVECLASLFKTKSLAYQTAKIDSILTNAEPDPRVRFFLKTNINKRVTGTIFRVPVLNFLKENVLKNLGEFPKIAAKFPNPVLVMRAHESEFILDKNHVDFERHFDDLQYEQYDCGHWIVTDEPDKFVQQVIEFIE